MGIFKTSSAAMVRPQSVYQDGDVMVTAIPQKSLKSPVRRGHVLMPYGEFGVPNERVALGE